MLDQYLATLPIQHGGNQSAIRARLRLGNRPLLDFSAPLNGLGPPAGAVAAVRRATETIGRYPEPGAPRLVERLAEMHGVPADRIIVGAGTTELISLVGQCLREELHEEARDLGIPDLPLSHLVEPTYGEYRRTAAQNGLRNKVWDALTLGWDQDFEFPDARGIVWTGHPNNPTGRAWDRGALLDLIDRQPAGYTVVDEAYLPFLPDEAERTVVPCVVDRENLIVMRSMTKIYAIPGLRIGYAVASPSMIERFKGCLQPWTVTTAAEVAALASIEDDEYLQRTIELIATESVRVTDRLWDVPGLRPAWPGRERPDWAPPMANFILASLVDTPWTSNRLQDALARRGLLVRECSNYHGLAPGGVVTGPDGSFETNGHLRFCIRTPGENDLLLATLLDVMKSGPQD
ncbi:MAG: aminotransferase class I/II-fold pyridoxal phosphate-dependent enzyme [Thermoleophilia bacterium]|nr:aminotransferase class I/II-fold pyridoxal phosphate-dependent enzyme [Thermoleophilia bacterium]